MPLILHYSGDRRRYDPKHLVGPDVGDGFLIPVGAAYDPDADTTTIIFQHLLKENWPAQAVALAGMMQGNKLGLLYREAMLGSRKALDRLGVTDHVKAILAAQEKAKEHE